MQNLPGVWMFYASMGILSLLEIIALYIIFQYFKLLKSYDNIMKKQHELEGGIKARSEQLMQIAQAQAQTIIEQANQKAQAIVRQADFFNQGTQDKINEALARFMEEQMGIYRQIFQNVQNQTISELQGMRQQVSEQAVKQMGAVSREFALGMAEAQKQAQAQLLVAYEKAQEEIDEYKTQRVKHMNQLASLFVQEAVKRFFKKTLTREQQETLVMEAFDEAQREKLF